MNLKNSLNQLKSFNESSNLLKEKIIIKIESIVKKYCKNVVSRVEIINNDIIVKFKTTHLDFDIIEKINKEIGLNSQLAIKKNSIYTLRVCYYI